MYKGKNLLVYEHLFCVTNFVYFHFLFLNHFSHQSTFVLHKSWTFWNIIFFWRHSLSLKRYIYTLYYNVLYLVYLSQYPIYWLPDTPNLKYNYFSRLFDMQHSRYGFLCTSCNWTNRVVTLKIVLTQDGLIKCKYILL